MHRLAFTLVVTFCFVSVLAAQPHPQDVHRPTAAARPIRGGDAPATTLHVESRLVVVDVVVMGHHREPVRGLTASDFILLEDGKPQKVAFFEEHEASKTPLASAAEPPTGPGEFTNTSAPVPSCVNVILFDTLNTPITDQPYARQQMIQFLKTLPLGYHVALFELGSRLRMLSGYNQTSEELVAAAKQLVPHASYLLQTDEDAFMEEQQVSSMSAGVGQYDPEFFNAMRNFMSETSGTLRQHRLLLTLRSLTELTQAMSGFRGRKNVIWLSEYFPVSFGVLTNDGRFSDVRSYGDLLRQTSSTLSSSQVALYPVDIRGLTSGFAGNASQPGGQPPDNVQAIRNIEARHIGMDDIAEQTGGHAYYNTNDLKFAMQRSLENGSSYYTLAYVPPSAADSKYHRIRIRLVPPGLKAEHRNGYFSVPIRHSESPDSTDFAGAVQPATPVSNRLLLKAQLQLPDQRHRSTRVNCTIDAANLTFLDQPNGRKFVTLHLLTVAWDEYLNSAATISNTVELGYSPGQYARMLREGVTMHQELRLRPGKYDLRIAVMEDGNSRIGSLEIPIEIP